jgi:hypothetical protein
LCPEGENGNPGQDDSGTGSTPIGTDKPLGFEEPAERGEETVRKLYIQTLVLFVLTAFSAGAGDKPKTKYPERGTVTSMHTELHDWGIRRGVETQVYVLRTESKEYDITGPPLAIGSEVSFRPEKSWLFILDGQKERKYWIYRAHLITKP